MINIFKFVDAQLISNILLFCTVMPAKIQISTTKCFGSVIDNNETKMFLPGPFSIHTMGGFDPDNELEVKDIGTHQM